MPVPTIDAGVLERGSVRLAIAGPLATITLDRPDVLNAQTPATWQALRHIGEQLDPDVRVVVVRGASRHGRGPPSFARTTPRARGSTMAVTRGPPASDTESAAVVPSAGALARHTKYDTGPVPRQVVPRTAKQLINRNLPAGPRKQSPPQRSRVRRRKCRTGAARPR